MKRKALKPVTLFLFVVILLSIWTPTSAAEENQEGIGTWGVGAKGCGDYLAARRKQDRWLDTIYHQWFLGFATGRNIYISNANKLSVALPLNEFLAYADELCRANPLTEFFWVAEALLQEKSRKK
ncbi:hypothetical protein MOJ79_10530 [Calidifontimicrobium sp. SYSU G02091]|uniref:hypothetical protein n=1 Tax=Calidifontimicrobium sp. SYSU G02091 TaxID=2926421 RepID=UPI001F535834|nr:hypothetical protein [Calidifontimicrobium sp. SYSU G02091]MCI1192278.1 hypothetical protein [Calidifontimicrobium sp. SYSU G02091]